MPFTHFLWFHHTYFPIDYRYSIHPGIWIWRLWSDVLIQLYLNHDCILCWFCLHLHMICYTYFTIIATLLDHTVIVETTIFTALPTLTSLALHDNSNTIVTLSMIFTSYMNHDVTDTITMLPELLLLQLILHHTYDDVSVVSMTCIHRHHGNWTTAISIINSLRCATAVDFSLHCVSATVTILDPPLLSPLLLAF